MASQDWLDKDFYKILGVAKDAQEAEIKKTYRKLACGFDPAHERPGRAHGSALRPIVSEAHGREILRLVTVCEPKLPHVRRPLWLHAEERKRARLSYRGCKEPPHCVGEQAADIYAL